MDVYWPENISGQTWPFLYILISLRGVLNEQHMFKSLLLGHGFAQDYIGFFFPFFFCCPMHGRILHVIDAEFNQ